MNTPELIPAVPPAPAALFPLPLRARHYLWAHHWKNLEGGLYSHPGHAVEDAPEQYARGGFTEAEAIADARLLDAIYWQMEKEAFGKDSSAASRLWGMAAYYAWLGEWRGNPWGMSLSAIIEWAEDRVPSIASLIEAERHPRLELEAA